MRKAIIDLGTNTFNLLIADVSATSFQKVYAHKISVDIGAGGINDKRITEEAQDRALKALQFFKEVCDTHNVQQLIAFGTSAIRDASNSLEFIEQVKKMTNIDVTVISGMQEAELVYKGIKWTYDFSVPTLIMDVGGGSTEFILADSSGIQTIKSLNIGISRVFQAVKTHDPLTESDVEKIEKWFEEQVVEELAIFNCPRLIAASGVFETFYEMIHFQDFKAKQGCYQFNLKELEEVLNWLIHSSSEQRDAHPFIIPIRKMMGPATSVMVRWVLRKLGVEEVWMSPYSMKEGGLI